MRSYYFTLKGDPLVTDTTEEPTVPPTDPEVPEGGVEAEPPPPAPIAAPPEPESLAEQVQRMAHTVPESTGPSDVVPNRPNIRPPEPAVEPSEDANEATPVEEPAAEEPSA